MNKSTMLRGRVAQVKGLRFEGNNSSSSVVLMKRVALTAAMMDGTVRNVFTLDAGDRIVDAIVTVTTVSPTGGANVDIGVDATFTGTTADADALINNALIDATTPTRLAQASPTVSGTLPVAAANNSHVTVQSATDYSGGAFAGVLTILYAKA